MFGAFSGHSNSTCVGVGEIGENQKKKRITANVAKTLIKHCHNVATVPHTTWQNIAIHFLEFLLLLLPDIFFLFILCVINLNDIEMDTHCPTPL